MAKSRGGGGGRKPSPTTLKELKGNPGRRPLNEDEPKPSVHLPNPPAHLSPMARREWRRAGAFLVEMGLMTDLDVAALAGYSVAYARWCDAEKVLRKCGLMVKDGEGLPVQSPYLAVANKAYDQMRVMMGRVRHVSLEPQQGRHGLYGAGRGDRVRAALLSKDRQSGRSPDSEDRQSAWIAKPAWPRKITETVRLSPLCHAVPPPVDFASRCCCWQVLPQQHAHDGRVKSLELTLL